MGLQPCFAVACAPRLPSGTGARLSGTGTAAVASTNGVRKREQEDQRVARNPVEKEGHQCKQKICENQSFYIGCVPDKLHTHTHTHTSQPPWNLPLNPQIQDWPRLHCCRRFQERKNAKNQNKTGILRWQEVETDGGPKILCLQHFVDAVAHGQPRQQPLRALLQLLHLLVLASSAVSRQPPRVKFWATKGNQTKPSQPVLATVCFCFLIGSEPRCQNAWRTSSRRWTTSAPRAPSNSFKHPPAAPQCSMPSEKGIAFARAEAFKNPTS